MNLKKNNFSVGIKLVLSGVLIFTMASEFDASAAGLKRLAGCQEGASFTKVAQFDQMADSYYGAAADIKKRFSSNGPATLDLNQCNSLRDGPLISRKTNWKKDASNILALIKQIEDATNDLDKHADQFKVSMDKDHLDWETCFTDMKGQKNKILESMGNPRIIQNFKEKALACGASPGGT